MTAIQERRPPVTADVAEEAGASPRTVSRVLDGYVSLGRAGVRAAPQQNGQGGSTSRLLTLTCKKGHPPT